MAKPSKPRNNIVELFRFIYSLLVLGYHIQFSYKDEKVDPFENGALAVEFYFLLSGYFLARSLEKISKDTQTNYFLKIYYFMKNKITALLNVHILSIVAAIIVYACCDKKKFWDIFLPGIPSIFLVHMIMVWNDSYEDALIIPEWYLSAMIICMLFMVAFFLLTSKWVKTIYSTLILLGILVVIVVVAGFSTKWKLSQNIVYDIRAWGEMIVGMFSFYLSVYVKNKQYEGYFINFFKFFEIFTYVVPVILGIAPINSKNEAYLMVVTVVCVFCAVFITFAEKGNVIKNEKVNSAFGYLGAISLPIYLFHPVLITLINYTNKDMKKWLKFIIVFPVTIILAFLYRFIADYLNKIIEKKSKEKKKEKEEKKPEVIEGINIKENNQKENESIEINDPKDEHLQPEQINS